MKIGDSMGNPDPSKSGPVGKAGEFKKAAGASKVDSDTANNFEKIFGELLGKQE